MVSFLFRTRFENGSCKMILLSSSARGFETNLYLLILLSSFARGSKLIFIYWYFYPLPLEVQSWSLNDDLLTWLDLHLIARLILFRSYTWKPAVLSLFHTRFWIFHKLMLCPSILMRFRVILTSFLFCTRFEVVLEVWYFYPFLHLVCQSNSFYSGLTLEYQFDCA